MRRSFVRSMRARSMHSVLGISALGISAVGIAVGLLAVGCGGGDGDSESTLTFGASTDLTLLGDGSAPGAVGLAVGDTPANLVTRAGLRFAVTPFLPAGAVVTSARLRLQQAAVVGTPYALFGSIVVDRVDFGLVLDAADFNPTVLASAVGTLSSSAALGPVEVDVTAAVQADVAANDLTSDFLLRFTIPVIPDGVADSAQLEDSENTLASGVLPELRVTYR